MKNNKYKILVLSDLKESASTTLKSSIKLAQILDAEIALFYAKKHIDIVNSDNQLSAIRTLNETHNNTKKKIESIINPIAKSYHINIQSSFSFGKIKQEIRKQIQLYKPDIIVLGQRESNPLQLIGDSITRFVLKEFKGPVFISASNNAIQPDQKMELAVLNNSNSFLEDKILKNLIAHTKSPLKSFKIIDNQNENNEPILEEKLVEYAFEGKDDVLTTISSYLQKNNINLVCVDRTKKKSKNTNKASIKEMANKLNVSLLVSQAS